MADLAAGDGGAATRVETVVAGGGVGRGAREGAHGAGGGAGGGCRPGRRRRRGGHPRRRRREIAARPSKWSSCWIESPPRATTMRSGRLSRRRLTRVWRRADADAGGPGGPLPAPNELAGADCRRGAARRRRPRPPGALSGLRRRRRSIVGHRERARFLLWGRSRSPPSARRAAAGVGGAHGLAMSAAR